MKIGIIREGRIPADRRVPFTPEQCGYIRETFPDLDVVVQPSSVRCFPDRDYVEAGITVQEDLSDCDILMVSKAEIPLFQRWHGTQDNRFHYIPPYLSRERMALQDREKMRSYLREAFSLEAAIRICPKYRKSRLRGRR